MGKPVTKWSHLIRLAIVLVVAIFGFFVARTLARPPSWNSVAWYRGHSLADIAKLPLSYGGNESCHTCHEKEVQALSGPGHWKLSCESCHGPLTDHIQDGKKVGNAIVVNESAEQCLNCHSEQINRPADFPQYRYQHGERQVRRQKSKRGGKFCLDCHDAHAPQLPGMLI